MRRLIDGDALCRVLNEHWLATSPSDRDTAEVAAERAAMCRGLDDAMRIVEQMPTVGGWISVKDRMPDKGHDVLAFLDDGEETRIAACNYWDGVWFDSVMNTIAKNVVCWMPLPEPPEEV